MLTLLLLLMNKLSTLNRHIHIQEERLLYYTLLFEELNTESKYVGEHFKICMSDSYDVFNIFTKIEQWTSK